MSSTNPHFLDADAGESLLAIARHAVACAALQESPPEVHWDTFRGDLQSALRQDRATFVTLYVNGALRGCLGSLEASEPVAVNINRNAYRSALFDTRFNPVAQSELSELDIQLSVLTPLEPLQADDLQELIASLRPGIDGVLITTPTHRGTFLPSVWEKLESPQEFLMHLWAKAGLAPNTWPEGLKIFTYQAQIIA